MELKFELTVELNAKCLFSLVTLWIFPSKWPETFESQGKHARIMPLRTLHLGNPGQLAMGHPRAWRQFLHVTWPHITPVVLFNLVISLVFTMQSFTESYFLETRQQKDGLLFFALYLYRVAFEPPYRFGYASALAWIFVLVLIVLIVPILLSGRLWVYYAGSERTSKG